MRGNMLREWIFTHQLDDSWWVALEGEVQPEKLALDQIALLSLANPGARIRLLHASMGAMANPPWVDYESEHTPDSVVSAGQHLTPSGLKLPAGRGHTRVPFPAKRKNPGAARTATVSPAIADAVKKEGRISTEKLVRIIMVVVFGLLAVLLLAKMASSGSTSTYVPTMRDAYAAATTGLREFLALEGAVSFAPEGSRVYQARQGEDGIFQIASMAYHIGRDGKKRELPFVVAMRCAPGTESWEMLYAAVDGRQKGGRPAGFVLEPPKLFSLDN